MTPERQRELECSDANLTEEEKVEGYHFCEEFDGLCTQGEMFEEDGITCICGFDRRKLYEYRARRAVDKLTASIVDEALNEMFGDQK